MKLQWGRDLIVAETDLLPAVGFELGEASMGPRLDSRGNNNGGYCLDLDGTLQWGRDLIVAETLASEPQPSRHSKLQWGRDLIVAETSHVPDVFVTAQHASMGPRLDSRGNRS